jgi:hypothetical protein
MCLPNLDVDVLEKRNRKREGENTVRDVEVGVPPSPLSAQEYEQRVRAIRAAGMAPDAIARGSRVPLMFARLMARVRGAQTGVQVRGSWR